MITSSWTNNNNCPGGGGGAEDWTTQCFHTICTFVVSHVLHLFPARATCRHVHDQYHSTSCWILNISFSLWVAGF